MARSQVAFSTAFSNHKHHAKSTSKKKGKETFSRYASASEEINATFNDDLFALLPEEIFDLILQRLPLATVCRFRCLGRRWRGFQHVSPPPPSTIVSNLGDKNARFYCNSEQRWISLPSNRYTPSGRTWEVVDADAGLVCYQCNISGWYWLWVCNPLKPSLSRLIQPEYRRRDPQTCNPEAPKMKLLVDRANKSYRIIAKLDKIPYTAVYESTTSNWTVYSSSPLISSVEMFAWGNVVYVYNTEKDMKKVREGRLVSPFDEKARTWPRMTVKIPCECPFQMIRFFLSNNNEVMLILFSYRKLPRPYFSIWKLLDEDSSFAIESFSDLDNWERVNNGPEKATIDLAYHRLVRASYCAEHIWFIFREGKIKPGGSWGYKCVRYSLGDKSWRVMPYPGDSGENCSFSNWEPSFDIDPS